MKILAIDCATEQVSAALWADGACRERSAAPRRGLSEELLEWCAALLGEASLSLAALDFIAFGRGPGSFTGVRMATSLAQGLAWSSRKPVVPVSTLRAIAFQALQQSPGAQQVLVCQDARMNEVYWARCVRVGGDTRLLGEERLSPPDAVDIDARDAAGIATGTGFAAFPSLAARWRSPPSRGAGTPVVPAAPEPLQCPPRARDIAALAAFDGLAAAVAPADAAPVYLRDTVATPPVPRPT